MKDKRQLINIRSDQKPGYFFLYTEDYTAYRRTITISHYRDLVMYQSAFHGDNVRVERCRSSNMDCDKTIRVLDVTNRFLF